MSTLWWQEDPRDRRQWRAPDIAAELSATNYRSNVDPAMKAVLEYRPEPSIGDRMAEALSKAGVSEAVRVYRLYMNDPRHAYADEEAALNSLGYQLLGEGRHEHAIAVLELNASEHPESPNVYDSLGEAYHEAGRRELAIRNYARALQLDSSNANARSMLEQLRQ